MSSLRWLSIGLGIIIFLYVFLLLGKQQRLRNKDKLVALVLTIGLVTLGIHPDLYNSVLGLFSFERGNGGRITGLMLFAIAFLYIFLAQSQARMTTLERTLDRLVNELAKEKFRQENGGESSSDIISVVIPAYNEELTISKVLHEFPDTIHGMPVEAIVIVDGGTDETESIVRAHNVAVATHIINRGGGAALHAGYDIALDRRSKIVVTLDADGQHMPGEIERVVTPIINGEADMVNGSRVLGTYEKDDTIRAAGVVFFNWLISVLLMQRITDCSNAFRAISGEALAEIRPHLVQRQYHSPELLIEMVKRGKRVIEVPITIRKRAGGVSKKGTTLRYAMGFSFSIIATWMR